VNFFNRKSNGIAANGSMFELRSQMARQVMEVKNANQGYPNRENYFEGGFPFTDGTRSYVPQIVQDARLDAPFLTRRELLRKARYFRENNPMVTRILAVDEAYTVGAKGLHLSPMSSDEEWNKRAKIVFHELCQNAGLDRDKDLVTYSHICHGCERTDGEIFALKTRRPFFESEIKASKGRVVGQRPCLQFIEGHRVETPFTQWNDNPDDILDGAQMEKIIIPSSDKSVPNRPSKRVKGFYVRDSFGMFEFDSSYTMIPVEALIQIGEAQRIGQVRYISSFYSTINMINSLDDLQLLEMKAAIDGAEKSSIVTNAAGQATAEELTKMRNKEGIGLKSQQQDPEKRFEERANFIKKVLGGRTLYLRVGEKLDQHMNNRPTVTSREYWMFLMTVICGGLGPSISMVFPQFSDNDQGTAIRQESDIDTQLAIKRGRKWRQFYEQVWDYFMGWAIYNDVRVADPPADWRRVKVFAPRAPNFDVGRNAQASLANVGGLLTTHEDEWGQRGDDWREKVDEAAIEREYIRSKKLTLLLPGKSTEDAPNPSIDEDGNPVTPPKPKPEKKKVIPT
jgi:hypothetical protein